METHERTLSQARAVPGQLGRFWVCVPNAQGSQLGRVLWPSQGNLGAVLLK